VRNIKFTYLYRDGANFKNWGEVIFTNPENLDLEEISERLTNSFLPDKLFVASQIAVPERFLFLDGKFTQHDHCYHEFDSVEFCEDKTTDVLGPSISEFLREVEITAKQGWTAFDILTRT
jgi:hypothetical protein